MPVSDNDAKGTSAASRLTFDRGLGFAGLPAEDIAYIRDGRGNVVGTKCAKFDPLPDDVIRMDQPSSRDEFRAEAEKQFAVLHAGLLFLRLQSTSCLLKAAATLHQLLLIYLSSSGQDRTSSVSGLLLDIFHEVEKRTRQPYQYKVVLDSADLFRPLPSKILAEFPLNQSALWRTSLRGKPSVHGSIKSGRAGTGLKPVVNREDRPVDQKQLNMVLDAAEKKVSAARVPGSASSNSAPLVTRYISDLDSLTLEDVYRQTNVSIRNHADYKLSELVEVVFYASYITLVLDSKGEPFDGNGVLGLFRYGMILTSKKFKTVKFLPPPGEYVSLGPIAGQQFLIERGTIKKLPVEYQGILGYQEVDVTGQWTPDYQEEANKVLGRNRVYLGSLVVESAYPQFQNEITLDSLYIGLQNMVDDTLPYLVRTFAKKMESWFTNYEDLLKEIGEEVVKAIVIETLKDLAKWYVIKKLGARIIPVINVVVAIKDTIEEMIGKDIERDNIAVNCVRLYLKGTQEDDRTLSSKIMANIMADAFEAKIKQALINKAVSKGVKLVDKVKEKAGKRQSGAAQEAKPTPESSTPQASTPVNDPAKATQADQDVIRQGVKAFQETYKRPENQDGTENTATPKSGRGGSEDEENAHDRKTGAKGTSSKGIQGSGKSGTPVAAVPSEPPLPPAMPRRRKKLSDFEQERDKYPRHIQDMLDRVKGTRPSKRALEEIREAVNEHERSEQYKFYQQNKSQYPPHVQSMVDRLQGLVPSKKQLADIDYAIRANYARDYFKATGIPFDPPARIPTGSGGDWEKINRAERTGTEPQLQLVSHTKHGDTVQIDDFDTDRRIPREYKASLKIEQKSEQDLTKELSDTMKRHAQFAEDYNLKAYEWVAHSNHSSQVMTNALSQLKGEAMKEQDKDVRAALLRRYSKISIVYEPIFDEE